ncbi:MAG: methionine ABC transporter ATP-binding protein [Planctomycetes bacterium]|nr:methionine ABC transporter ATP-binding protein [Planctomycetota bacterium]
MIQVRGLSKRFGSHLVLDNVDMTVNKGEVFGIVGHSGAGKSTLLRCLNGLERYSEGSVKITGREVNELPPHGLMELRRGMGMIFQTFNLMARKNVFENIAFPLQVWKTPAAQIETRVEELLEMVGLMDKRNARVQSLSGGQKQRVGIARALALKPEILLCDEATSALDPKTTTSILELLESINKQLNLTVVLVTHQMEVVKRLCNRMLLLDGGVTQAMGSTEELFLSPPQNLKKLIEEEYTLIPNGINIRLMFPREISQDAVITTMARELNINFSIAGGKLERYLDDVFGFLIINVPYEHAEVVMQYLRDKKLYWQVLDTPEGGTSRADAGE